MLNFLRRAAAAAALLLSPVAWGQTPATTDADPALWVVKDKDTTVYLFGTVHVLKPGLTWFDEAVRQAFDKSDELVLELADPTGPETIAAVMKIGMAPAGKTLPEKLSESQRAAYVAAVKSTGMPATAFDRQKPWLAAITLQMLPLMKLGYDPMSGPEVVLIAAAKAAGKPIRGLETPEQQLAYLDGMPEPQQIEFLGSTVEKIDEAGPQTDQLVAHWAKGDDKGVARVITADAESKPLVEALLTARNRKWAEWIDARMDRPGTVFVAVGAGHLAGDESVQAFLKKRRHKAKRIKY